MPGTRTSRSWQDLEDGICLHRRDLRAACLQYLAEERIVISVGSSQKGEDASVKGDVSLVLIPDSLTDGVERLYVPLNHLTRLFLAQGVFVGIFVG